MRVNFPHLSAIVVITLLSLIYLDVSETKDAVIKFTEQFEYVIEE
jgi:hypothetical protein